MSLFRVFGGRRFSGWLLAACALTSSLHAEIVNRWSFNNAAGPAASGTALIDSISGATAYVRGTGATFTGVALTLSGTTTGNFPDSTISGYVDLPNGIISSKTNLTVEVWFTAVSSKNWQRVFDFGRTTQAGDGAPGEWTGAAAPGATMASDNLMLAFERGTTLNTQRMQVMLDGVTTMLDTALTAGIGAQHHGVLTYQSGAGTYPAGGRVTWYFNGVSAGYVDVAYPLSQIEDVNNWLGRSQYSGDSNSNLSYNEVRIYDNALSASEVAANYMNGPELGLLYRWSFNNPAGSAANGTVLADAVSGAQAIVRGAGATFNGASIVLPGTTIGNRTPSTVSAYVDLPNGILSGRTNATIEIWATPVSAKSWQRLFDFGTANTGEWAGTGTTAPGTTTASDEFALSLANGVNLNQQRLYGRLNYDQTGGLNLYSDTAVATTAGQRYHHVVTFEDGVGVYSSSGGRESWYRDGVLITAIDLPYHLSDINDVNNWLGRSQFSGDSLANVAIDEFRLYSHALTPADIASSRNAGPDTVVSIPAPVANADAVTMHMGQKARITVLGNDTGAFYSNSVSVVTPPAAGTASVDASGKILYTNTAAAAGGTDSFSYTVTGPGGVSAPAQVTVTFSSSLRISNPALAMPAAPPATFWQVTDALPGVAFTQPICMASAPGETNRLFVCERMAKIQCVTNISSSTPVKNPTPFLDLQQVIAGRSPVETIENGANQEFGLLGLAFHPNYATNGYFYVAYTVRISGGSYYERISRFKVSTDPNLANPGSELILLQQLDEGANHNGGDLHFGPDGYLYYAAGDEENGNDVRHNSQRINKDFFAGIFRIDVDKKSGNPEPNAHAAIPLDSGIARFSVPRDNPYVPVSRGGNWNGTYNGATVTGSVRMEFWATGLRHVWRFSFDSLTGDLWAGDVGQGTYEEVDKIVKGGNYGWVWREAAHDTGVVDPELGAKPAGFASIDPNYEYVHSAVAGGDAQFKGNSVCGGVVYRGSRFASLYGSYIFCDSVSGHIWKRDPGTGVVTRLTGVAGTYGYLVSMGVDPSNQDVLFCDYINGRILRLGTGSTTTGFPATLSETGLFADLADLSPNPGLLPYDPNLKFWSDYADKRRWFTIPSASGAMTWSKDANWTFPTGMLWVKHFDLQTEPGNSATTKRLETRVVVKTSSSAYGVSYRWNDAQTDATLVPDEGVEFDLNVLRNGTNHVQHWTVPGRTSCNTCHTPQAGSALSFSTRQLNRTAAINGFFGNQLTLLHNGGFFANDPGSPNLLPRHLRADETAYPVEARVRSYLAVNCAYCHRADGTAAGANWEGRPEFTLAQTNLINGVATNYGGDPDNRYIVSGSLAHSIVYNRVAVQNGFTRMPPLATNELDPDAIAMLQEWITSALPARLTYDQWRLAKFGSSTSSQGDAAADPDGDGRNNQAEYIANTNPLDAASYLTTQFSANGSNVTVTFNAQAGRTIFVETSTNLTNWSLWDVSGNNGTHPTGYPVTLTGPALGSNQFFRLRISEN